MAIQQRSDVDIWSDDFAATRRFLERFGIASRPIHEYDEEDVLKAIRARGWEPTVEKETNPPGWVADISEWHTVTESRSAIAHDPDRMTAVLRALRIALSWQTLEEEVRSFDEQTRSLLNMSAVDFISKLHAGELDPDNPVVGYLLIARPIGW